MNKYTLLFVLAFLLIISNTSGQALLKNNTYYPEGLSFSYGYSLYSEKDKFISDERYSGTASRITGEWTRFHEKNIFRLGIDYLGSANIKNNNISSNITEGFLCS